MVIPKRILSYRHASNLNWMLALVADMDMGYWMIE